MMCLLTSLRSREKEREKAFVAVGLVAVAVKKDIQPYLSRIMEVVKVSLSAMRDSSSKKRLSGTYRYHSQVRHI